MSALSNYLENKILDHILGTAAYTMPTAVYIGLFTTNPDEDASGSEVAGNGYARAEAAFDAAAAGSAPNTDQEEFTADGGTWGTVTHWALFDAVTTGNMLVYGAFDVSREVLDGDTVRIQAGDLVVNAA